LTEFRFRGKSPRGFIAASDVDAAEEDGVDFDFDAVLEEGRAFFAEFLEG